MSPLSHSPKTCCPYNYWLGTGHYLCPWGGVKWLFTENIFLALSTGRDNFMTLTLFRCILFEPQNIFDAPLLTPPPPTINNDWSLKWPLRHYVVITSNTIPLASDLAFPQYSSCVSEKLENYIHREFLFFIYKRDKLCKKTMICIDNVYARWQP